MKTNKINNQANPNFNALKKIRCQKIYDTYEPCSFLENRIISELKDLASKQDFFKRNNVKATVTVERYHGARVELKYKPIGENFVDKVKNFFKPYKEYIMRDSHPCPDDSSYFIAKNLRDKKKAKDFLEN